DVDRHIERLRALEDRPEFAPVNEFAVGKTMDHRALEAELGHGALEFVRGGAWIRAWQHRERLEAAVRSPHRLAQPVVRGARNGRCRVGVEALRRRRAVREHLDVDADFVHLADAQRADIVQPLAQRRIARLRPAFLPVLRDFRVYVMLFECNDHCEFRTTYYDVRNCIVYLVRNRGFQFSFQRARARASTFSAVRGMLSFSQKRIAWPGGICVLGRCAAESVCSISTIGGSSTSSIASLTAPSKAASSRAGCTWVCAAQSACSVPSYTRPSRLSMAQAQKRLMSCT